MRDEPDQDIIEQMKEAYKYIKENNDKNIFVHCVFGKSRSASVIIFYIMNEQKIDFNSAKEIVKSKRDIVNPNIGFQNQLNSYYEECIAPFKKQLNIENKKND